VTVSVEDAGEGMPADVLARVGEPFVTTRGAGDGMGLGLFLARRFAEGLGGALDVSSRPGETRVSLVLPASAG
jgi:two-component system sensor histidine kinase RegB